MKQLKLLLFLLLVLVAPHQQEAVDPTQPQQYRTTTVRSLLQAPTIDCPGTCLGRCGHNWKNEMCNKMCNVCCKRCNCVPPGTGQDTRYLCPCYDTMVNPRTGKLKCP